MLKTKEDVIASLDYTTSMIDAGRRSKDPHNLGMYIAGCSGNAESLIIAAALVASVKKFKKTEFEDFKAGVADGLLQYNKLPHSKHKVDED
jgi:hypothetical protein